MKLPRSRGRGFLLPLDMRIVRVYHTVIRKAEGTKMTFLEQIEANNDPNNPDRIKARELLAKMETPKVEETVQ